MAKYTGLFEHLCKAGDGPVELSFDAIGTLVGGMPTSAYTYSTWWGNEVDGRHVQARAWMNAGRMVDHADLTRQTVRFSAAGWNRGS